MKKHLAVLVVALLVLMLSSMTQAKQAVQILDEDTPYSVLDTLEPAWTSEDIPPMFPEEAAVNDNAADSDGNISYASDDLMLLLESVIANQLFTIAVLIAFAIIMLIAIFSLRWVR